MRKKTSFRVTYQLLLVALMLLGTNQVQSQSITRQSINSMSGNSYSSGLLVRQSVGQPYFTGSTITNGVKVRPGFQQPASLKIKAFTEKDGLNFSLDVYPNPVTISLNLKSSNIIEAATLRVFDIRGNEKVNEQLAQFTQHEINCADWPEGIYFLTLTNSKNQQHTSKIIISK